MVEDLLERPPPDFHADSGAGTQSGSIEGIADRGEFDRVGDVFIDRHLQQLTGHPVGGIFDALAGFGFYAIAYDGDHPVSDDVLHSDLLRVLEMLKRVYAAGTPGSGSVLVASADQSGQARVPDTKLRKAIEDHSMAVARALYNEGIWQIDDVSRYRSYDLHLRRKADGYEVHVEVKGTASAGVEVFLTKEEVKHAKSYASTVLVIVHDIQVQYQDGTVVCHLGTPRDNRSMDPSG